MEIQIMPLKCGSDTNNRNRQKQRKYLVKKDGRTNITITQEKDIQDASDSYIIVEILIICVYIC